MNIPQLPVLANPVAAVLCRNIRAPAILPNTVVTVHHYKGAYTEVKFRLALLDWNEYPLIAGMPNVTEKEIVDGIVRLDSVAFAYGNQQYALNTGATNANINALHALMVAGLNSVIANMNANQRTNNAAFTTTWGMINANQNMNTANFVATWQMINATDRSVNANQRTNNAAFTTTWGMINANQRTNNAAFTTTWGNINATQNMNTADFVATWQMINATNANIDNIRWEINNNERKNKNYAVLHVPNCFQQELLPLRKLVNGFGPGLPGHPIPQNNLPVLATGSLVPVNIFPTVEQLYGLDNRTLSELSAIYNDDFGIVAADDLKARRCKFVRFIS